MDFHRSMTVTTTPDQLDPNSVAYLRAIEADSGNGHPGTLAWQTGEWFTGPRAGRWPFLLLGLALLGALAGVCGLVAPHEVGNQALPYFQAALAGGGTLFLLLSIVRFLRPKPHWLPQSFVYADASYLWEVRPSQITAIPLANLESVDGMHYSSDGSYTHSSVQLKFPDANRHRTLYGKAGAENVLTFLQYLIMFRRSEHEHVRQWAHAFPGRLGAAAARLVSQGPSASLDNLPEAAAPPVPYTVPADPKPGWGGTLLGFLGAAVVGLVGLLLFPLLNDHLQHDYLFAQIPAQDNGQFEQMQRYLAAFPNGRHAPMVREMLDDRRFARAQREAKQFDSPGSLRAYLADTSNQRHRPAAQRLIADYYDRAIADLKKKQANEPNKIDKELFENILALLEGLKGADRPVVTVGFKATLEREPVTKEHKERETWSHSFYLKQHPELTTIAERSPSRSAIIHAEQVFDAEQTARREAVILERLRAAVQQGINADILTLEPSAPGETPVMEVSYHVLADGKLGKYTDENQGSRLVGLLRWYAIHWTITIRPPGTDKALVYTLRSEPGAKLTYDADPTDPSWAIYAVLLYSGFYDMSARLIRNFGLDPGPAPNAFSFAAVARHAPDKPDKVDMLPNPLEKFILPVKPSPNQLPKELEWLQPVKPPKPFFPQVPSPSKKVPKPVGPEKAPLPPKP